MAIDMHSHYYGGLIDILKKRTTRPYVSFDAQGRPVLNAMTASTVITDDYTDLKTRLAYLDAKGICTQLMTFPGALGIDVMPVEDIGLVIGAFNDHLAEICRSSSGRFVGLAGLPLADMPRAAAEMRRVRRELGLLGAILPSGYFMNLNQTEALRPVLAAANEVGALLMIHPGQALGDAPPMSFPDMPVYRASGLALQASLSHVGITLIFSEMLDVYQNVAIQLVNLGGTLPFILERLEAIASSRNPEVPFPKEKLRRLYYDSASLGPRALELAVKVLGADRIMLGTDYPIFTPDPVTDTVREARIEEGERQQVLRRTASAIISRLT